MNQTWIPTTSEGSFLYVSAWRTLETTLLTYRVGTNKKARSGSIAAVSQGGTHVAFASEADRIYDASYPTLSEIYRRSRP